MKVMENAHVDLSKQSAAALAAVTAVDVTPPGYFGTNFGILSTI